MADGGQVFVRITDANGDHLMLIGPFNSMSEAVRYSDERESRRGNWHTYVHHATRPDALSWEPGESVYGVLP